MGDVRDGQVEEIKLGETLSEGKTKIIYKIDNLKGCVLLQSKDRISAHDGKRQHELEGKAAISNDTTCEIFKYLTEAGIRSHFVRRHSDTSLICRECAMIPIEWVTRRVATGSFLRRNPGVPEGYRFTPIKLETFYKDDAAGDPEWSEQQVVCGALLHSAGHTIGQHEYDLMAATTRCVFEVLETAWAALGCALIDMKIEFGVDRETGELLLADVIDSDSWRLWPAGDKRLQVDKQLYRDMAQVTSQSLDEVKRNFTWVAQQIKYLHSAPVGVVAVLMGSAADSAWCDKISAAVTTRYGLPCVTRVTSAHKSTADTLSVMAQIERECGCQPVVYIAVAGRSNGLGPVISGNTCYPVINCPPNSDEWTPHDIWSSLHLPSGLACATVLSPEAAAQCAAQILASAATIAVGHTGHTAGVVAGNHRVWAKLRVERLNTLAKIKKSDVGMTRRVTARPAAVEPTGSNK